MKTSIAAALTLLAGIAVASPAWSADTPPQAAERTQAGEENPATDPGTMDGMGMRRMGMMGGFGEHDGMGRMPRMHHMMMRRMHMSPQQRCEARIARRAGRIAYTGTMLKLTPEQRPLWDKLTAVLQANRDKQLQLCGSMAGGGQHREATAIDRLNRAEQFLSARLDGLHQVRPLLDQLYQALTPEQRSVLDRRGRRG